MWITSKLLDLFHISRDTVDALRADSASLRAERDALQRELSTLKVNFDWLRIRVNSLELERTALLEKAYNIKLPAPELARTPAISGANSEDFSFEDMGDRLAKKYGFPVFDPAATDTEN